MKKQNIERAKLVNDALKEITDPRELTGKIQSLSNEDFHLVNPSIKRSCYDCNHITTALNYWCGNEEAIKDRGTRIPGCIRCPYWEGSQSAINEIVSRNPSFMQISNIKRWLVTRRWLWKKVVFDNSLVGKNYHRYDHRIYSYSHGMGNFGKKGGKNEAIFIQLNQLDQPITSIGKP